ncbi:RNA 2',3'-cyclic phosphodiesterase [Burkholderiaceae bacterium DAT-1]|nr:RNA 2',3'-cyclic phosphodiesterase [Burkholderiaceae bacterium DAT-1]
MARIFLGIWPDENTRDALAQASQSVHQISGGRIMAANRLHLTLAFLGEVDESRVGYIARQLEHLPVLAMDMLLDQYGFFGNIGWLGCANPPDALMTQARLLRTALRLNGIQFDDKPFVPHVTLVRDAKRRDLVPLPPVAIRWQSSEIVLAEADDRPGQPYRVRGRFG